MRLARRGQMPRNRRRRLAMTRLRPPSAIIPNRDGSGLYCREIEKKGLNPAAAKLRITVDIWLYPVALVTRTFSTAAGSPFRDAFCKGACVTSNFNAPFTLGFKPQSRSPGLLITLGCAELRHAVALLVNPCQSLRAPYRGGQCAPPSPEIIL